LPENSVEFQKGFWEFESLEVKDGKVAEVSSPFQKVSEIVEERNLEPSLSKLLIRKSSMCIL